MIKLGAEYLELKAPANGYEIPNLPQLKDQEIWYAYEAQGNLIHSETYREYNKAFYEAMIGGINIEADFDAFKNTDYWEKYMLNTFQFSAAKSAAEMKMLQGYVFGKNGERVPFEQFKEVVEPIVGQFKEQWLRVEYDLAAHGAVMGQRWNDLYRDRDLFPYWVFTTRKDDRVRKHHEELEGKIFKFDDPYAQQFWPPLDWNCYDKETLIYTKRGFVYFNDLLISDLVYTINPITRIPEWQKPINYIKYHYKGDMINIEAKNFSLCTTPNHQLLLHKSWDRHEHRNILKFYNAQDIADSDGIYKSAKWKGVNIDKILIAGKIWNTIDFVSFMGWYLSEGSVSKLKYSYQVNICQEKKDNLSLIFKDVENIPYKVSYLKDRIAIYDNDLGEYLSKFGKSNQKYIPDEILNLSQNYLSIFLDRFIKGDGHIQKGQTTISGKKGKDLITIFSTSELMIDQLIEISIKLEKCCYKSVRKVKGKMIKHKNGIYTTNNDMFRLNISDSQYFIYHKKYLKQYEYNDFVYCVEVPKFNTLLINRKGKIYWCGNCRCEGESTDEGTPLNKSEMEKYTGDIGKGFEGNVGIDGIFPKTKSGSSYFNVLPNANKAKPEMFKEQPVAPMPKPEDALNDLKKQVDSKYEDVLSKLRGATDKFKKTQEFKDLEQKIEAIKRFQYKIKDFDSKNIDKNFETLKEFINFKGNQQDLYGDGKILGSSISKEGSKITSTVLTEDAYLQRTFDIKKKSVSMDEFFLNPTISQSGKGTQIFYNQVNQFKDLGFKKLETEAGAARGMNGYYTWARVGYDIKDKNELKIFQSQMKMSGEKEFKNVKSLQELMVTKKGRDYWRKEGGYFHGEFDLTTGSNSMKILDQYIKQKNEKNKAK